MFKRNGNKAKKINLLDISDEEKLRMIGKIKQNLRLRTAESKLWQSLLEVDNLTVNGQKVICEEDQLTGLSPSQLLKNF
jgi:hypothetical protein